MKHRFVSDEGVRLIKRFESFSARPYICPAGLPTIGYGHVIRQGEAFTAIDGNKAEDLLVKDLFRAERAVLRLVNVPLSDGQFDALVSFVFNLGGGALQRSTLRMKLNRGEDRDDVAPEFLRWVYGGGRKPRGLVRRRRAEVGLFLS